MRRLCSILILTIGLALPQGMMAQSVLIHTMDGKTHTAEIKGKLGETSIRLLNMDGSGQGAVLPYHFLDKITFPDNCTMTFGGSPLKYEGISNPGLEFKGTAMYVEGLYKLGSRELKALLPDGEYAQYRKNRILQGIGIGGVGVGGLATMLMTIVTLMETIPQTYTKETDLTNAFGQPLVTHYEDVPLKYVSAGYWLAYAGLAAVLAGGITCLVIANKNLKGIAGRFNAAATPGGFALQLRF